MEKESWASGKKSKGLFPVMQVLWASLQKRNVETEFLRRTSPVSSWDPYLVWNGEDAYRDMREGEAKGF